MYLNYLQDIIKNMKEVKIIAGTSDVENTTLQIATDDLYKNQFLKSCTLDGIKRYEDMLGITCLGTDTLQDRIFRVVAYYNKQLPYTKTMLEQNLAAFCGQDGYKTIYDYENDKLTVKIALTAKQMINTVKELLETVVPLNIVVDCLLLYNTQGILTDYTHSYLAQYTHQQLREDVINK